MLINREIYENALRLIGEGLTNGDCEDYEERAPYLIASFCSLVKNLDKIIRKAESLQNQEAFNPVFLSLEKKFPMCETLAGAAALYVAAMLVIDEDAALSDSLYDKYCDTISSFQQIKATVAAHCESIVDKYFFK